MELPQRPPTHQEVKHQLWAKYDSDIASGRFAPFSYPFGAYGSFAVLCYFLFKGEHRRARWLVWGVNFLLATYCILCTRARSACSSYGVGLGNAWSILWFTAILLVNDGKKNFNRIERIRGATLTLPIPQLRSKKVGDDQGILEPDSTEVKSRYTAIVSLASVSELASLKYYNQHYPAQSFLERLDWSIDLMSNFRGVSWNWRTSSLPPLPKPVVRDLVRTDQRIDGQDWINGAGHRERSAHFVRYHSSKAGCLHRAWRNLIFGYIMLDVVKTLCIHDPYFSGLTAWPAPNYFLDSLKDSAILVRCCRLPLAMFCIYLALQTIFALAPIVFVGFLGAKRVGVRGEPWMYPEEWGSYSIIFDAGLAGWWGVWWHQTFRYAFEAPASWILRQFPALNDAGPRARAVQLFTAFCLSGFLHASGSYTSIGETRPLSGSFLFFLLQPLGIVVQIMIVERLRLKDVPSVLKAFNFIYTHVWFYYTAPFLIDDFVKSGIYLYEPVPVSFLRALGFGAEGDSWWCWDGPWISWYWGRHWWQSGIAT